jgi:Carboxypeptidase regulatory-like domain/TonB dependent receptor
VFGPSGQNNGGINLSLKIKTVWLIAILAAALPLFSQSTSGNLTGTVYDQSGASIPNAAVSITNVATGVTSGDTSTASGVYQFNNLPVGAYTINVSAGGFTKSQLNNVRVELNQTVTANISLAVGQSVTSVEVSEAAIAIDTTTAQLQSTFDAKQMADLPSASSGSGVLNLSLLNAGVATSGSVGAGTGPTVAGQRPRNNNFTVEGIDNNRGDITGPIVAVPNDAVSEFGILQNQFSPDFGHSSGGQFNLVVKGGTNSFHGAAYEYFQNRNLDAADNINAVDRTPLHPRFDSNRFGGNVGGPIRKNKLFFFGDYQYNPVGAAGSAGLLFGPTQAGWNLIASTPGVNQSNLAVLEKYLGTATGSCGSNCPTTLLSSLGAGPLYKQATRTGTPIPLGQISVATPSFTNYEAGVGGIDYNPSEKDAVRGRFILNRAGAIDTSASLPAFFETEPTNSYLATVSEYHDFSAVMTNELRLGYNKFSQNISAGNFAFPGLNQFPNLVFQDLQVQLGPNANAPQYTHQNTYQLTDNLTWSKGSHTLKFGFDGQRNISPQAFTQRSRGDYEYNHVSDYLFDFSPDYIAQRSAGDPVYWGNRWLYGFYANDSWKIRHNLTLNLGLRYEYDTLPASETLQSLNAIASVPGLITFGAPKSQTTNFMPRVGIAYTPGTSGKTSFRAGFGTNYDVLFDNLGLLTLPPQLSTTQDVTGSGTSNFLTNGGLPSNGPSANFSVAQARSATAGFVPNVKRPYSIQWNFGVEHEFAGNYVFETRYVGTRGVNLDVQTQLNRQPAVTAANALPVYFSAPGQAVLNSLTNTLAGINAAVAAGGEFVPAFYNAGFNRNSIVAYQPIGNSSYNGWANQLTRRFHLEPCH